MKKSVDNIDDFKYWCNASDGIENILNKSGVSKKNNDFVFKSDEDKEYAEQLVRQYGERKLRTDNAKKRILENDTLEQKLIESCIFLSRLFDLHYEDGFNEILLEWRERLIEAMMLIKDNFNAIEVEKKRSFIGALSRGETCYNDMDVLIFNKF